MADKNDPNDPRTPLSIDRIHAALGAINSLAFQIDRLRKEGLMFHLARRERMTIAEQAADMEMVYSWEQHNEKISEIADRLSAMAEELTTWVEDYPDLRTLSLLQEQLRVAKGEAAPRSPDEGATDAE